MCPFNCINLEFSWYLNSWTIPKHALNLLLIFSLWWTFDSLHWPNNEIFRKIGFQLTVMKPQDWPCSWVSPSGFAAGSGTCCRRWWSWVFRKRPGSLQTWSSASCWSCPVSGTPATRGEHRYSSLWTKSVGRDKKLERNSIIKLLLHIQFIKHNLKVLLTSVGWNLFSY